MPAFSIPTLPSPTLIDGRSSIPPPSADSFDAYFGGFLPERHTLTSELGQTTYYVLSNMPSDANGAAAATSPASGKKPVVRRAILMHGASTPCINLVPLAEHILLSLGTDSDSTPGPAPPTELLLYDLWGHGLSSTPLLPATPSLFHFQLLHLLAALHWPRAHLVGFSASGSFAVSFAAHHPALCASVTLIAPTGLLRSASVPLVARLVRSGGPWGLWRRAAVRSILDLVDGGQPPRPPAGWREHTTTADRGRAGLFDMEAVQVWQRENHAGHVALLVALYHAGGLFDLHHAYAAVARGPLATRALVMLGQHDALFGGDVLRSELRAVRWLGHVVVVPDVGHLIVREKPAEAAQLLVRYWAMFERGEE